METIQTPLLIVNAVILLIVLYFIAVMTNAVVKYSNHPGDLPRQIPLRYTILRCIVFIVCLGFFMAFINLLVPYLY